MKPAPRCPECDGQAEGRQSDNALHRLAEDAEADEKNARFDDEVAEAVVASLKPA